MRSKTIENSCGSLYQNLGKEYSQSLITLLHCSSSLNQTSSWRAKCLMSLEYREFYLANCVSFFWKVCLVFGLSSVPFSYSCLDWVQELKSWPFWAWKFLAHLLYCTMSLSKTDWFILDSAWFSNPLLDFEFWLWILNHRLTNPFYDKRVVLHFHHHFELIKFDPQFSQLNGYKIP